MKGARVVLFAFFFFSLHLFAHAASILTVQNNTVAEGDVMVVLFSVEGPTSTSCIINYTTVQGDYANFTSTEGQIDLGAGATPNIQIQTIKDERYLNRSAVFYLQLDMTRCTDYQPSVADAKFPLYINNTDPMPLLIIAGGNYSAAEGENITVHFSSIGISDEAASFSYSLISGSALPGRNYVNLNGSFSWEPLLQMNKSITIRTLQDNLFEAGESRKFSLFLFDFVNINSTQQNISLLVTDNTKGTNNPGPKKDDDGVGPWVIISIVVGAIVGILLLGIVAYFISGKVRGKKDRTHQPPANFDTAL